PLLTSTATLSTCAPSPLSLPSLFAYPFFFSSYGDPRDLHSFPTRRSSDLLKHYNPEMRIVLPGALPDPREARELTPYLHKTAPTLAGWMEQGPATTTHADPAETGCTPYEAWQLRERGFRPQPGQNLASGLGPLYLGDTATHTAVQAPHPVWLVELVHVSPSRDGAALLPAADLDV